jgi:TPP-dependent indolepyruvate ferredoxin oxidoreductase alpha subunit
VLSLFPIPERAIRNAARGVRRIVVAEENMSGLYRRALTAALPDLSFVGVNGLGGMIRPAQILEAV